jgi:pyruvate/2-oxoglutarate dehydrogenase complex dihydrolipoamide dehydrogenase (E3) component
VSYLRDHAERVSRSSNIVVIGGGAVGVQTATDIKELYPNKSVTLLHSRNTLMNRFHTDISTVILNRFTELGIKTVLGSRTKFPSGGYPADGSTFNVELENGTLVPADFAVRLLHMRHFPWFPC